MTNSSISTAVGCDAGRLNCGLDLLLIRLGGRYLGLPLTEVRHICSMPTGFAAYGPETEKHFVFQGSPLPYVSLWNRLGLTSEFAEYEELLDLLSKRKQDHLDWMNALEKAIQSGTAFTKARDPRECAFGKWYYGYRANDRRLSIMMDQFEKPHAEIHGLANKLLALVDAGQQGRALQAFQETRDTTFAELLALFDSTQKLLLSLQRRAAVIVASGDGMWALGTDGVRDIVAVPFDRIKPASGTVTQATSALAMLDDRNVVPLIDWRAFFMGGEVSSGSLQILTDMKS